MDGREEKGDSFSDFHVRNIEGKVNVINATRDQLHNKETFLLNLFCLVNLSGSIHFFGPVRGVVDNGMRFNCQIGNGNT